LNRLKEPGHQAVFDKHALKERIPTNPRVKAYVRYVAVKTINEYCSESILT
jgi:hypothetical protein